MYVHKHFDCIKKQMINDSYYEFSNVDTTRIAFCDFISNLELSAIQIHENDEVEILIDSEKCFFDIT